MSKKKALLCESPKFVIRIKKKINTKLNASYERANVLNILN